VTKAYTNEEDARKVCDGDINLQRLYAKFPENSPSGIVTKPPKPGCVGFGSTYVGHFQNFWAALSRG
jgi:hypothetical protein